MKKTFDEVIDSTSKGDEAHRYDARPAAAALSKELVYALQTAVYRQGAKVCCRVPSLDAYPSEDGHLQYHSAVLLVEEVK